MGDPMSEPMRDTLARIDALREQEAQRTTWILSRGRLAEYDLDALVAEHNAYPQVREMLERAHELLADEDDECEIHMRILSEPYEGRRIVSQHDVNCHGWRIKAWLADYEGAQDA